MVVCAFLKGKLPPIFHSWNLRNTQEMQVPLNATHQLSYLEQTWLNLFQDSQYPAVRLAIIFFLFHELVFIGRYIPYLICDHINYFKQFKIQAVLN